jgi:RNA polymerase sigma-70 factor (ECF subfamily)
VQAVPTIDPHLPARPSHFGEGFADLLGAARADAGWAYERLWEAFSPAVLGYLRTQGVEDPEAITNEVFLRAFTNLARFDGDEAGFRSWLFTIAHHAAVDDRRRQSRRPRRSGAEIPDEALPAAEDLALALTETVEVLALLDELSPDQREVLVLRIMGDLTLEATAQVVGKRLGAVKALQRRGLATLRRRIAAEST